jgi:hypothetical protein
MNSKWSFALALCLGVLAFSHADADHHKKKHKDKSAELTQCTIQSSKGGMGCVAPLKRVCEKLKNGQSCCACVGDKNKNAKASQPDKSTTQDQAPPAQNDGGTAGDVPAATLLLPGFETDLSNPSKCKGAICPK